MRWMSNACEKVSDKKEWSTTNAFLIPLLKKRWMCTTNNLKAYIQQAFEVTCNLLILILKMEPMSGIEPLTYALRKRCSTD